MSGMGQQDPRDQRVGSLDPEVIVVMREACSC